MNLVKRAYFRYLAQFRPITLVIDPVGVCDLHCPSCPRGRGDITATSAMPYALFRDCLTKAQRETWLRTVFLFGYGEALLNPQIGNFVALCKERRVHVAMSSTLNVSPERILHCMPDVFIISLSGWRQSTYEKAHVGGDIAKVKDHLAALINHRADCQIRLHFHQYTYNRWDEQQARWFAREHRLRFFAYEGVQHGIDGAIDVIEGRTKPVEGLLSDPIKVYQENPTASEWCTSLENKITVDAKGIVQLCCGTRGHPIGEYLKLSHKEILERQHAAELCKKCTLYNIRSHLLATGISEIAYREPLIRLWHKAL